MGLLKICFFSGIIQSYTVFRLILVLNICFLMGKDLEGFYVFVHSFWYLMGNGSKVQLSKTLRKTWESKYWEFLKSLNSYQKLLVEFLNAYWKIIWNVKTWKISQRLIFGFLLSFLQLLPYLPTDPYLPNIFLHDIVISMVLDLVQVGTSPR